MKIDLVSRGVGSVVARLKGAQRAVKDAYEVGNRIELEALLNEAIDQTPIDTGALRQSGYVRVDRRRWGIEGRIGFTAHYAIFVHETNRSYRVGKWKYLEDPWKRAIPGWDERVAKHVAAVL